MLEHAKALLEASGQRECPDLADFVARLTPDVECAWLDSATATGDGRDATQSFLGYAPLATLNLAPDGVARLEANGTTLAEDRDPWRLWREVHATLPQAKPDGLLGPGWIGYVGFEGARTLERLRGRHAPPFDWPAFRWSLYDRGICVDHARGQFAEISRPELATALGLPPRRDVLADHLSADPPITAAAAPQVRLSMSPAEYEAMIARGREYIAAGDIYQVNLAHALEIDPVPDPIAAYLRLRTINPARYAALLRWNAGAVMSASPELMLAVDGRDVRTSPIKGTRRRGASAAEDQRLEAELLASAKERAELTMIVDLHRNDLGRVCEYGSVRVTAPRRVEHHPTVIHTVADVTGRLRAGVDAITALQAGFPAGSITGVPKIRALEIIDELEPVGRGVYTGTIGQVGLDGRATFNVAIRTVQWRAGKAMLHVGGGIVADSCPAAEYAETLAKGRGILRAFHAEDGFDIGEHAR
jgi:para-aminobenzoate synthetase component 1